MPTDTTKVNVWPLTSTVTLPDRRRFTLATGLLCTCGATIRNTPEVLDDDGLRLVCTTCHRDIFSLVEQ
jgi:hypothetical protein